MGSTSVGLEFHENAGALELMCGVLEGPGSGPQLTVGLGLRFELLVTAEDGSGPGTLP
jgi:hypothetical protein